MFIFRVYSIQTRVLNENLKNIADEVDHTFSQSVTHIHHVIYYMGRLIGNHNTNNNDTSFIINLFNSFAQNKVTNQSLSWTLVSWVDANGNLTIDARKGILKDNEYIFVGNQPHVLKSKEQPWAIQLAKPQKGNTSGKYIIPGAIGVLDKDGNYLGSLIFGFDLEKLEQQFSAITAETNFQFAFLDAKHNPVLSSSEQMIIHSQALESFEFSLPRTQTSSSMGIIEKGYYAHKLSQYPYVIYLTHDSFVLTQHFLSALKSNLFEIIIALIVLALASYYFRKIIVLPLIQLSDAATNIGSRNYNVTIPRTPFKEMYNLSRALIRLKHYIRRNRAAQDTINQAYTKLKTTAQELVNTNNTLKQTNIQVEKLVQIHKDYDKEKEEFLQEMYSTLNDPLNFIINAADILRQQSSNKDVDQYYEYHELIYQAGMQLKNFTTNALHPEKVDAKEVIEKCIRIQRKFAIERGITLESKYPKTIPSIWLDKVRFRQVLLSLLYHSLLYVPQNKKILVSVYVEYMNHTEPRCLVIKIEDNGIGHSRKLRENDWNKRSQHTETEPVSRNPDATQLSLETIYQLVRLHHGSFDMQTKAGIGSTFTVRIPYLDKDDIQIHPDEFTHTTDHSTIKLEDNIVLFPTS